MRLEVSKFQGTSLRGRQASPKQASKGFKNQTLENAEKERLLTMNSVGIIEQPVESSAQDKKRTVPQLSKTVIINAALILSSVPRKNT